MCIALPAKINAKNGNKVIVTPFSGQEKEIDCTLHPDAKPGDYALAYGGQILKILKENEAVEMIELLNKVAQRKTFFDIIKRGKLTKNDVKYLMTLDTAEDLHLLFSEADRLRDCFLKKTVCVHGAVIVKQHVA